jgi:hypothetical protein
MYHIIIQTERRTQPERMAIPILEQLHHMTAEKLGVWTYKQVPNPNVPPTAEELAEWLEDDPDYEWPEFVSVKDEFLPPDFSDPQFVMVVEWDGISPYVIQHKGDYSTRTMEYAGWPQITKEQHDAIQPADPL